VNDERHCIDILVRTEYLPGQSRPDEARYAFAYHIRIRNDGTVGAQLLTRHWVITDADQQVQKVRGEGVVGKQPRLAPGESFTYSSGAVLRTPVGAMHGSYAFIDADGITFDAPISPFTLAVPGLLN
jgi:ApaG protein